MQAKQYTIRNVPSSIDRELRRRVKSSGKSFNQVALEALAQGAGTTLQHDDLDFMIGTMTAKEAKAMDREVAAQRLIDDELWR